MKRKVDLNEISDGRLYSSGDMVKVDCHDCEGCSACCQGMGNSIILDPMDLWRLQLGKKENFDTLLANYLELNVVDGMVLPNKDGRRGRSLSVLERWKMFYSWIQTGNLPFVPSWTYL